jgi:hypothetical protein
VRVFFAASVLAAACAAACRGGPTSSSAVARPTRPTVPSPPNATQPPPVAVITLTGGNGPAECSTGPKIGSTVTYEMAIARSGDTLRVILDPHNFPTDLWADYDGTVEGDDVTVSGHYYGTDLCGGGNVQGMICLRCPCPAYRHTCR